MNWGRWRVGEAQPAPAPGQRLRGKADSPEQPEVMGLSGPEQPLGPAAPLPPGSPRRRSCQEPTSPLPQASLPWHIRGAPGQPEAEGHLRTAAGHLALAASPAPRPSTAASAFSSEAGRAARLPLDISWRCCPTRRPDGRRLSQLLEEDWWKGQDSPRVGEGLGPASREPGLFLLGRRTGWELSLQPVSPTLSHRPFSKEVAGVAAPTSPPTPIPEARW